VKEKTTGSLMRISASHITRAEVTEAAKALNHRVVLACSLLREQRREPSFLATANQQGP
jgi:hypothetical protein